MKFTTWIKSLFAKPQPVQPLRPAGELIRRLDIWQEMNGLTAQIARLRKNKKKFSHLEARLASLRKIAQPNDYDVRPVKTPEREKVKQ